MNDYVYCHRCGILLDSAIAIKQYGNWYCSDKCYEVHKAYLDGYHDGRNDKIMQMQEQSN